MREVGFDRGVVFAQQMIRNMSVRPRLLAVYGERNAGKTSFIDTIASCFRDRDWRVISSEGVSIPVSSGETRSGEFSICDLFLFHFCGPVPRESGVKCVSVGVYNPELHVRPFCGYDLLVCNPDSVVKDYANAFSFKNI